MRRVHCAVAAALVALGSAAGVATADPSPAFPDLSGYAPVNVEDYVQDYSRFTGFDFVTPDGQLCSHNRMNSLDDPDRLTLSCEGPRPDLGPGTWQVLVATDSAATVQPSYPPLDPVSVAASGVGQLPAGHKIVYRGIECGVDADMTACRVGEHGFVLTPTATTLF